MPLRPLSFSEILDGAFQAIRTNPRTMLGFAAVVLSAASLLALFPHAWLLKHLGGAAAKVTGQPTDLAAALSPRLMDIAVALPKTILIWLASVTLTALLVVAVNAAVLGEKTSPGQLWQRVRHRIPAAIGLSLLTGLIISLTMVIFGAAALFVGALLSANSPSGAGAAVIIFGGLTAIALGIMVGVRTSLAGPVLLLENNSVSIALRRSWRLTRGSTWRLFMIFLVVGFISLTTSLLIQAPFLAVTGLVDLSSASDHWGSVLITTTMQALGESVAGTVLTPWSAAIVALLYLDLRIRREGLDLERFRASHAKPPS